jgi:hypothetical protein
MDEQLTLEDEQAQTLRRVEESHKKDYDGSRRKYADEVSTSTALRKRRMAYLAQQNGHG